MNKKQKSHPTIHAAAFIELTDLVPESWGTSWFFGLISEDADFSWGDNNRTLITAERFYDHCVERLEDVDDVDEDEKQAFIDSIEALIQWSPCGGIYIDLEN